MEPLRVDKRGRPHAHFTKDIWDDRFDNFSVEDKLRMDGYTKEIEPLREDVLIMLLDNYTDSTEKMRLIDVIERLGVPYYYANEINELLDRRFKELAQNDFNMEDDLYDTALQFRIFRQHGHKIPCDVFNKFRNGDGEFKEILKRDVRGMISLYEAAYLRVHGEDILENALVFTTDFLKSMGSCEQARFALNQPLHRGYQRLQARRFISLYEEDESHNEKLLQLAKIEFNRLQLLHRQELNEFRKWWKKFDFETKLPYVRQRSVESHFWSIIMYYEPQYTLARRLLSKIIISLTVLDDTYDAYGTFEELKQLTDAFDRWDSSLTEQFPEDYMKIVYKFVINIVDEFVNEMRKRGEPYAGHFFKEQVLKMIRNYFNEIEWVELEYVPTFEEYMVVGRVTAGVQSCVTTSLLGMEEVADQEPYAQLIQAPKAVEACEYIVRLMDDIVTHEAELARGCRLASSVECYMKEYNKSTEEVLQIFNQKIEDAWKDLAQEGLLINHISDECYHFAKPTFDRILNYARSVNIMYKVADGFSQPEDTIKEYIITTYSQPFSI